MKDSLCPKLFAGLFLSFCKFSNQTYKREFIKQMFSIACSNIKYKELNHIDYLACIILHQSFYTQIYIFASINIFFWIA